MAAVTRSAKTVRKLEKPRPLKISSQSRYSTADCRISTVEDIMTLADTVCSQLTNGNYDQLLQLNVVNLCTNLKQYGQQLESVYHDQLDRCFVTFRNGSTDEKIDYMSRMYLLEIIELRARHWVAGEDLNNYYRPKQSSVEDMLPVPDAMALSLSPTTIGQSLIPPTTPQPTLLNPGEVIKASGKFAKPTKIPGKNYCKDEVVIRNSDSGKVNPGAKERLVQITGPNEEKINYAKHLIEDTIRRNASPVRLEHGEKERVGDSSSSLNSSASDESNRLSSLVGGRSKLLHSFSTSDATLEYKYTVTVGDQTIKITGANLDLVYTAKILLDDYFSGIYDYQQRQQVSRECDEGLEIEVNVDHDGAGDIPASGSNRIDGIDSGATSDSEETYKAPASGNMKPEQTNFGLTSVKGEITALPTKIRQQSVETPTKETETLSHVTDVNLLTGIPSLITETTNQLSRLNISDNTSPQVNPTYIYSREQLLQFALSKCVKKQPADWERICREYPGIITKELKLILNEYCYHEKQRKDLTRESDDDVSNEESDETTYIPINRKNSAAVVDNGAESKRKETCNEPTSFYRMNRQSNCGSGSVKGQDPAQLKSTNQLLAFSSPREMKTNVQADVDMRGHVPTSSARTSQQLSSVSTPDENAKSQIKTSSAYSHEKLLSFMLSKVSSNN